MRWIVVFVVLILSCATTSSRETLKQVDYRLASHQGDIVGKQKTALDSIIFTNPIIDFCLAKNNQLLLLDANQEKIFTFNLALGRIDTIVLPQKIYFLKGIAFDGIFSYLYTDNSLYQYDRKKQVLNNIIKPEDRIKINDIAITSAGEIFISDDLNNQIVFVNSLGKVSKFNIDVKDLFVPAGLYYSESNSQLYLINKAQNRIEIYSYIGNRLNQFSLPDQSFNKISVSQEQMLVWDINKNSYYQRNNQTEWSKKDVSNKIANLAIMNGILYVLDSAKGIFIYKID